MGMCVAKTQEFLANARCFLKKLKTLKMMLFKKTLKII
jgi:hypothetical protein